MSANLRHAENNSLIEPSKLIAALGIEADAGAELGADTGRSGNPHPTCKLSHGQGTILKPITDDIDLFTSIDQRRKGAAKMRLHFASIASQA